jgi:hypothetical protein
MCSVVAGCVATAPIVWADRDALAVAIAEIDTTAVLTRHDSPIDNRGVKMGASPATRVATTADDESP